MRSIKGFIIDTIKAFIIGALVGIIIAAIFTFVGLAIHSFNLYEAAKTGRNAAIIVGSLIMILSAGFILKKDEIRKLKDIEGWKRLFPKMNFVYVMLIMSYGIVLTGGIMDIIIIMNYK